MTLAHIRGLSQKILANTLMQVFIYSTKIKDHLKQRKILIQHDCFFMKEKIV